MMEIIASCGKEFGLYSKLNELSRSRFAQPFLTMFCTRRSRPRYQVSVYKIIGSLVCLCKGVEGDVIINVPVADPCHEHDENIEV